VQLGERSDELPAGATGLRIDVAATVDRVLDEAPADWLRRQADRAKPRNVAPVVRVDEPALEAAVRRLVSAAEVGPSAADLRYTDGGIALVPPVRGQQADPGAVEAGLRAAAAELSDPQGAALPVAQGPAQPVDGAAAEAVAARARAVLDRGVVLRADGRSRTLRAAELGPELTVVTDGAAAVLGLRSTAEAALAEAAGELSTPELAPQITAPPPEPLLQEKGSARWSPRPVSAQMTDAGRPARSVAAPAVVAALSPALAAGEPPLEVDVPSVPAPASGGGSPAVVDAVLGTFTTSFTCCEPRVTNIRLIAATVDGTVVQPGEQLSLNGLVGPRTRAKGYVEAPFISGGMLSTDVGGGVSQFATTMFNAAFFAGVRLDDFRAHSFYISRYPAGREATINYPSIDLAWTNDTDTPLLVRTATTGTSVTVALYGRDDGRTVTGTTETAERGSGRGFTARVRRTVEVPGSDARVETFTTRYNPAPR
jgi:vancomycin resistance protein YoaR